MNADAIVISAALLQGTANHCKCHVGGNRFLRQQTLVLGKHRQRTCRTQESDRRASKKEPVNHVQSSRRILRARDIARRLLSAKLRFQFEAASLLVISLCDSRSSLLRPAFI